METLNNLAVGESATIKKIGSVGQTRRRIMDMGLTKGTKVYVRKVAPLGDPMELSVRKGDAELIEIEDIQEAK